MTTSRIITGLALLLALTSSADAITARTRPFRCVGSVILDTPNGTGSGHARHVGRVTGRGAVVEPGTARVTLEAANGDEIELTAHYRADGSGGWIGSYEITGGTGRFEDAAGSGELKAERNSGGTIVADAKGSISY